MPTEAVRAASKLSKDEWREYTKTVWQIANVSSRDHPAVFPPEIPRRLIKLFSFVGETVLDPFAGVGTTAVEAVALGRRGIAVELNKEYVEVIESAVSGQPVEVHEADSRSLEFLDESSVDLVVTSPPYWNKADYGSAKGNLGNLASYTQFLREMRTVFDEMYRVLRPGRKICVITANVNQHTDHGLLTFPIAADFTVQLRESGFVMINELIWSKDKTGGRWGSAGAQRPIFGSYPYPPNFLFKNVHEYILVFAKPPERRSVGKTVRSYDSLMAVTEVAVPGAQTNGNGHNGNGHNGNGHGGDGHPGESTR